MVLVQYTLYKTIRQFAAKAEAATIGMCPLACRWMNIVRDLRIKKKVRAFQSSWLRFGRNTGSASGLLRLLHTLTRETFAGQQNLGPVWSFGRETRGTPMANQINVKRERKDQIPMGGTLRLLSSPYTRRLNCCVFLFVCPNWLYFYGRNRINWCWLKLNK